MNLPFFSSTGAAALPTGAAGAPPAGTAPPTGIDDSFSLPTIAIKMMVNSVWDNARF